MKPATSTPRRPRRRLVTSPLLSAALLALVFLFGRAAWGMMGKAEAASAARDEAEQKLAKVQASKQALAKEADALASPAGVEEELRARFNVARAGEEAVVIVEPEVAATATPAEPPSLMERLWDGAVGWL